MSEHRHCYDCGGTDGHHYNDCIYDGTDSGYSSRRRTSTNVSMGKWWALYVIALVIGYGINELLGVILLIGLIFWLLVN